MTWSTYWLEATAQVATGLRRYTRLDRDEVTGYDCADGWHAALAWTGRAEARFDDDSGRRHLASPADVPRDDPRWPAGCDRGCGYRFGPDDEYQPWQELLYLRPADGTLMSLHPVHVPPGVEQAGPGASYDATWYPADWRGPDGIALAVLCPRPDGSAGPAWEWGVDRPSSRSGGRWIRTGDPRAAAVTASPSIAIGNPGEPGFYHGFLQAGVLTDHLG